METLTISLIVIIGLFAFLAAGMWVGLSLFAAALAGMYFYGNDAFGNIYATSTWGAISSWSLTALPLFIWMGEILFRTRLAEDLFKGLSPWLQRIPGKLLHVNIISCGIFAAVSGSSAATAATIGKMTLPELRKRGYSDKMAVATLAGSGTLGLLIPPSIILIVYGVAAEVSIARLFIAGILPGLLLVSLFMGFTMIWSAVNKNKLTTTHAADEPPPESLSFKAKIKQTASLIPVVALITFVLGSIYGGLTTTIEAAAFGVLGALVLSLLTGTLSKKTFMDSLMGATKTSCMIALILAGAAFLTTAMAFLGLPNMLATMIAELNLSTFMLLLALTGLFIFLGCFLDGISVVVLTTSVVLPMISQSGIDLLWFGIFIVLVVEMSQITPPVGFNLFVIQGLTGKDLWYIAKAALPFFLLILLAVLLIILFPEIVTFLPEQMTTN
ncbi:TRAP transporter large permease subunit [Endozoicomonas sp. SM1973]|uniref:TRAP transporter large permease protein n=1 Tax=Spartinivicinus marinus TaxID=2994442 RepID=A0A853I7N3_9GAMM|nr:TRAP transporter large permease subunit [Spartinivicinus marinus]MCX4029170.1 TRAP transporter large permease subunit [Spartinivicinus marinus]NYZ65921.1 TRAP transporter large permease subunit [Spartinivicinus marinus]